MKEIRSSLVDHKASGQRIARNYGLTLGGAVVSALLSLAALALVARGLGPELFGVLALVQAYSALLDRLFAFQTWQVVIRFGALTSHCDRSFGRVVSFAYKLDMASSAIAAISGALGVALAGRWFDYPEGVTSVAVLYCLASGTNWSSTGVGVLRLLDEFKAIATIRVLTAFVKLTCVAVVFAWSPSLLGFAMALVIPSLLLQAAIATAAVRRVRRQRLLVPPNKTSGDVSYSDLWAFAWTTSASGAIRSLAREADILVVGALLGAALAGIYKLIKQSCAALNTLSDPLYQAIYPELSRMWAAGNTTAFYRLVLRGVLFSSLCCIGVALLALWFGRALFSTVFGPATADHGLSFLLYLSGTLVGIAGFPLQPAVLAKGAAKASLYAGIVATIALFGSMFMLAPYFGLPGVAASHLVYYFVWSTMVIRELARPSRASGKEAIVVG